MLSSLSYFGWWTAIPWRRINDRNSILTQNAQGKVAVTACKYWVRIMRSPSELWNCEASFPEWNHDALWGPLQWVLGNMGPTTEDRHEPFQVKPWLPCPCNSLCSFCFWWIPYARYHTRIPFWIKFSSIPIFWLWYLPLLSYPPISMYLKIFWDADMGGRMHPDSHPAGAPKRPWGHTTSISWESSSLRWEKQLCFPMLWGPRFLDSFYSFLFLLTSRHFSPEMVSL